MSINKYAEMVYIRLGIYINTHAADIVNIYNTHICTVHIIIFIEKKRYYKICHMNLITTK